MRTAGTQRDKICAHSKTQIHNSGHQLIFMMNHLSLVASEWKTEKAVGHNVEVLSRHSNERKKRSSLNVLPSSEDAASQLSVRRWPFHISVLVLSQMEEQMSGHTRMETQWALPVCLAKLSGSGAAESLSPLTTRRSRQN